MAGPGVRPGSEVPTVWDAEVLSRVRHLHLQARVRTDALLVGAHRSRRVGQAIEFADYQEYVAGMDLRRLDWRVMGRTDRLVVRRYETETELAATVVLDLSGDLGTGAGATRGYPPLVGSKAGYAVSLAATFLYWLHRHGEPVGLRIVGGTGVRFPVLPPRTGANHLRLAFLQLASVTPGGTAGLASALTEVGRSARRRSLVVVISDGMEEPATWLPSLRAFTRRGTDLRFVHLYDRQELTLDVGPARLLYSPEGGAELPVDPDGVQRDFREVVAAYLAEVRHGVVAARGQYLLAASDDDPARVLRRLVHGGSSAPGELP
ncbi:MAG: DUF58 domain-containing protein [Alphaproteobacteria bacterium]|nr:DUF58 domain-containing protein [Alphaproteobacteria bacterium]